MLISVVEVQGLPDFGIRIIPHILPAFHKSLVPFKNSCSGHRRISINITQRLQSLSRRFSKFDTKLNVISLLNRHSAIELPIAKKLNQISQQLFSTSNQSR